MEQRGKFIVLEGIDGSGKSLQVEMLGNLFKKKGIQYYITKEPTNRPIGQFIRKEILSGNVEFGSSQVIQMLMASDRLDHLTNPEDGILEILSKGINVICHRYYLSSLAYTDSISETWDFNKLNIELLRPDLTIFLQVDPMIAINRMNVRGKESEIFENLDKLTKTHNNYISLIKLLIDQGESVCVVDANLYAEEVCDLIWKNINTSLFNNEY